MSDVVCSWCGVKVPEDEGYRAVEPAGLRRAAFCRLEHVVPWVLQGAHWDAGEDDATAADAEGLGRCARCGEALGDRRVRLGRHRGPHRIGDAFCRLDHLLDWAKAGGRWGRSG
jgi:hypothetical protein